MSIFRGGGGGGGGGGQLSKLFLPPFWKGVYSQRKEFAPRGSKFFSFSVDTISEAD